MASTAVEAGRKSLTATSLFSFFLSVEGWLRPIKMMIITQYSTQNTQLHLNHSLVLAKEVLMNKIQMHCQQDPIKFQGYSLQRNVGSLADDVEADL